MPTTCVAKFHCGAYGQGWLNGDHPMPQDGRVKRRVCFHLEGECCKEKISIQVRNCGKFMVYFLPPAPRCPLKYCGSKVEDGKFGRFFTRSFVWKTCVQMFYWGLMRGTVDTSGLPASQAWIGRGVEAAFCPAFPAQSFAACSPVLVISKWGFIPTFPNIEIIRKWLLKNGFH